MSLLEQMQAAASRPEVSGRLRARAETGWKADGRRSPGGRAGGRDHSRRARVDGFARSGGERAAGRIPELETFLVVDPLDGTKGSQAERRVHGHIARVSGQSRAGVVLAPVTAPPAGSQCFRCVRGGTLHEAHPIETTADGPVRIVASRSHGHPAIPRLCEKLQIVADVSVGSSLKFGLLASGAAQLYPRFGPTCEWDTAAGQAVLEAAGGVVLDLDGRPLTCGHPERRFLNGPFVAAATRELAEIALAEIANMN